MRGSVVFENRGGQNAVLTAKKTSIFLLRISIKFFLQNYRFHPQGRQLRIGNEHVDVVFSHVSPIV